MPDDQPLLEARELTKVYPASRGALIKKRGGGVQAVRGVSLQLRAGETLGIVGESGSGKSTLSRLLLGLESPSSGEVRIDGDDIFMLSRVRMRELRRRIQVVLQDPYSSLNPRMTAGAIVGEAFEIHPGVVPRKQRRERVRQLFDSVGLPAQAINRYPHEFSGGQRQRIGIARALALQPDIVICDEPVSALDVSVQAQVVNLLQDLQDEFGLSYVFIAHDLSVVQHVCDRIAVMYLGEVVEIGATAEIYESPSHPYTQALISAAPVPDPGRRDAAVGIVLSGETPSAADPPSGCAFRTRCWKVQAVCAEQTPALSSRTGVVQRVACHFAEAGSGADAY
jgi:oligopeptide transport system ATP-binding protein